MRSDLPHWRDTVHELGEHSSATTQCILGIPEESADVSPASLKSCSTAIHSIRVGDLIKSYGVSYHQFTGQMQLLVAVNINNAVPPLERLTNCSAAVLLWFLHDCLICLLKNVCCKGHYILLCHLCISERYCLQMSLILKNIVIHSLCSRWRAACSASMLKVMDSHPGVL